MINVYQGTRYYVNRVNSCNSNRMSSIFNIIVLKNLWCGRLRIYKGYASKETFWRRNEYLNNISL